MLRCLPRLKAVQHNEHRGDLIKCQESAQKSRDVKAVETSSGLAKGPSLQGGVTNDNFCGLMPSLWLFDRRHVVPLLQQHKIGHNGLVSSIQSI